MITTLVLFLWSKLIDHTEQVECDGVVKILSTILFAVSFIQDIALIRWLW